jgi:hypothetical protein
MDVASGYFVFIFEMIFVQVWGFEFKMTLFEKSCDIGWSCLYFILGNYFALPLCGVKIECLFFMMEVMVIQ